MKDKEFLKWIYDRLINVHGESPNVDYMQRLHSMTTDSCVRLCPDCYSDDVVVNTDGIEIQYICQDCGHQSEIIPVLAASFADWHFKPPFRVKLKVENYDDDFILKHMGISIKEGSCIHGNAKPTVAEAFLSVLCDLDAQGNHFSEIRDRIHCMIGEIFRTKQPPNDIHWGGNHSIDFILESTCN